MRGAARIVAVLAVRAAMAWGTALPALGQALDDAHARIVELVRR